MAIYSQRDPDIEPTRFRVATSDLADLAWAPDGSMLAVWDSALAYKVAVYRPDGACVGTYQAYDGALGIRCVTWSPDSQLLAIGSYDQVRLCSHGGTHGSLTRQLQLARQSRSSAPVTVLSRSILLPRHRARCSLQVLRRVALTVCSLVQALRIVSKVNWKPLATLEHAEALTQEGVVAFAEVRDGAAGGNGEAASSGDDDDGVAGGDGQENSGAPAARRRYAVCDKPVSVRERRRIPCTLRCADNAFGTCFPNADTGVAL